MSTHSCSNTGRKIDCSSLLPASCPDFKGQRWRDRSMAWERKRAVEEEGGEQSSQCVTQPARGSLLQPQATSGKHLFSSFVSSLLSRPGCLLGFFVVVVSSSPPHQHRKLKCNEAEKEGEDNGDCLAANQMSIKQELMTRSIVLKSKKVGHVHFLCSINLQKWVTTEEHSNSKALSLQWPGLGSENISQWKTCIPFILPGEGNTCFL